MDEFRGIGSSNGSSSALYDFRNSQAYNFANVDVCGNAETETLGDCELSSATHFDHQLDY